MWIRFQTCPQRLAFARCCTLSDGLAQPQHEAKHFALLGTISAE
jgi:hypothetical protein